MGNAMFIILQTFLDQEMTILNLLVFVALTSSKSVNLKFKS